MGLECNGEGPDKNENQHIGGLALLSQEYFFFLKRVALFLRILTLAYKPNLQSY